MDEKKPIEKKSGRRKLGLVVIILVMFLIIGAGLNFYIKYTREKQKQIALEQQKRLEEEEKERLRKLLEQKRQEFLALIEQMKKFFKEGNFAKVRELANKAFLLAKEYDFPTDEITRILHEIDIRNYRARLKELQSLSQDIFHYLYVRTEAFKVPDWPQLHTLRSSIIKTTYENEYRVSLMIADEQAKEIKKGVLPKYNYMSSKAFLEKGIDLREKHHLKISDEESIIINTQNEFFFASKELRKDTIPPNLYR